MTEMMSTKEVDRLRRKIETSVSHDVKYLILSDEEKRYLLGLLHTSDYIDEAGIEYLMDSGVF